MQNKKEEEVEGQAGRQAADVKLIGATGSQPLGTSIRKRKRALKLT